MKRFLSVLICMTLLMSCLSGVSFAAETGEFTIDSLEQYVVYEDVIANDGYIGIPVGAKTYIKGETNSDTPIIIYVVNTNTKRVGTESDETIITSFLDRGYAVVVLDYYGNEKAVCPELDWSLNKIKTSIRSDMNKYLAGRSAHSEYVYILPAGYNITRQVNYWSFDKHGYDGTFEFIMSVWNADFLGVWGEKGVITFEEDTKIIKGAGESEYLEFTKGQKVKVKDYTAMLTGGKVTDISQCIKRNGKPIDMNLYMDIMYPANPENEVPVLVYAQSGQNTVGTWNTEIRPHMSGFLLRGYAGVLFDYAYVPMSRADNWGYYDGDGAGSVGGVTGDNYTYSLGMPSSVKSDTAAVRYVRYLADMYPETYKFDKDKYGAVGISKSGSAIRLGSQNPETVNEMRIFEGQNGLTRYENGKTEDILDVNGNVLVHGGEPQPWLTYKDGSKIPSNVQFTSTTVGSGDYCVTDGDAPMYIYGTIQEGGSQYYYYPNVLSRCFTHDIPTMYYAGLEAGHTLCIGTDAETGNDAYEALFTTADYWLRDMGAKCEYIKPLNGAVNVKATEDIIVKFNGSVPEEEISKIKITNAANGEVVHGVWKDSYGDTEWTFTPYNLKGGNTYTVYVPATVKGANGKNIIGAKSSSFTVEPEMLAGATYVGTNMIATSENGAYFEVEGADVENSTTVAVRFGVKNDAANNVLVYSADENGDAAELLGKVNLDGAGEYDIDVTDYVKSLEDGEKAAFVLKAEKQSGKNVIYSADFEGITTLPSSVKTSVNYEISSETGGSSSFKMTGVEPSTKFAPYHIFYGVNQNVATFDPIGKALSKADYGRKFNAKFKLYDSTPRIINIEVGSTAYEPTIDGTAIKYSYVTEADKWNEYSFDYRAEGNLYTSRRNIMLSAATHGADTMNKPLYIDDFTLTEIVTDVEIASAADGMYFEPSLILHPADKQSISILNAGYVENAQHADTSFEEEDVLLVSGRNKGMSLAGDKMVYAKVDLSEFDASKSNSVTVKVTEGNGELCVYGIVDGADISTLNYINALGIDRYTSGTDLSKAYGTDALSVENVTAGDTYSIDITDYAEYMIDSGKTEGYLLFTSNTVSSPVVFEEDFNDGKLDGTAAHGGEIRDYGVDATVDIENDGYSYRMVSKANYDRVYFDLMNASSWTEADIGRTFEVTYWLKADGAGKFSNRLYKRGTSSSGQAVTQTYTTANQWQKFTYKFVYNQDAHDNAYNQFAFGLSGLSSNTIYVDNIVIRETGIGNVKLEFEQAPPKEELYSYSTNCNTGAIPTGSATAGCDDVIKTGTIFAYQALDFGVGEAVKLSADENYPLADGTQKSVYLKNRYSWVRLFMYNVMDSLTEDDLGRRFNVSFYVKASKAGSFTTSVTSITKKDTNNYNTVKHTISAADVGKWVKINYPITVTADMIANNTGLIRITSFSFSQSDSSFVDLYFDNIESVELHGEEENTNSSYAYENSFSTSSGFAGSGFEQKVLEDGTSIQRVRQVSTVDRKENVSTKGAVEVLTNKNYNRFYLTNIFESLTEEDIGRKYRVSFWMKSDTAGSIKPSMSATSLKGAAYAGEIKHSLSVAADEVNKWKKYTYFITIDEAMVNASANYLYLPVGAFTSGSTVEATLYFDDVKSIELVDGEGNQLYVSAQKTVSSGALTDAEEAIASVVKASTYGVELSGIRKAYISFEGSEDYKVTQKATLNIDIAEANGQTLKIYGLINSAYPGELTYNSAPANNADESLNESYAYGGTPLAVLEDVESGILSIDVTEYVKEVAPTDPLFAIVSEDVGGTQYITLDFETFKMTNGVDYIADADIIIADGAAKVADSKITLLNIFGNSNASVKAGEVYEISFDITSDNDSNITAGAAKADGEMVGDVANISALAGESQNVKFSYTATEEDEQAGVCAVAVESNTNGFSIDNLKVSSTTAVAINKNAELMVEVAKDAEIGEFDEVVVNVTVVGGDNVSINGEDKGDTTTHNTYRGSVLDMVAEGDGVFMYWIDADSNTILSYDEIFSYTVGTDRSIAAVYAEEAEIYVTFTSMANKVVASGIVSSITVPADPYVYGYKFNGWYIDAEKQSIVAGDSITAEENTEYKAGFVKDNTAYSVNVNGEVSEHTYNEKVTLTADAENFSYWKRDGVIVSYNTEYSFYVNGDTTVEAVYGENVNGGIVLAMANPVLVEGSKIAFFAERDIPEEYTLIESGILIGYSAGVDIDNAQVKAIAKSTANKGQYTIRKAKLEDGTTYYGATYAIYRDASGVLNTAYSNEVSYEYKITE